LQTRTSFINSESSQSKLYADKLKIKVVVLRDRVISVISQHTSEFCAHFHNFFCVRWERERERERDRKDFNLIML